MSVCRFRRRSVVAAGLLVCAIGVAPAHAQLKTQHIKGTFGLKGGTSPPPHWYLIGPLIYGFVKVKYHWETYARATTQGGALTAAASFPLMPIRLPTP